MAWIPMAAMAVSALASSSSASKGSKAQQEAQRQAIEEQRRQYDLMRGDMAPYRNVGSTALNRLSDMYNLDRPFDMAAPTRDAFTHMPGQASKGYNINDPLNLFKGNNPFESSLPLNSEGRPQAGNILTGGLSGMFGKKKGNNQPEPIFDEGGYNTAMDQYNAALDKFNNRERGISLFEKDPGYDFRLNQGIQGMDRSANARGVGLSGGALQQLNRYNQDYASNEFTNYANRLSSLAGIGQASTNASSALGQSSANNISGLLSQGGQNRANMYQSSYGGLNNAVQGGLSNYMFYDYMNKNPYSQQPGGGGGFYPYGGSNFDSGNMS